MVSVIQRENNLKEKTVSEKTIFNRRQILQGACAVAAASLLGGTGCAAQSGFQSTLKKPGLRDAASAHNKNFGVATMSDFLSQRQFADAVRHEANMLVPEAELKMSWLRPTPEGYNFKGYDRLADFVRRNNMKLRGHTLIWHESMPQWAKDRLRRKEDAAGLMKEHINTVMDYTKSVITDWDVVNEAIDAESPREDKLRVTPWLEALGPDYIAMAYQMAHENNPNVRLVYNEYAFEYMDPQSEIRRRKTFELLESLLKRGVKIHALGLQSHLLCHKPLAPHALTHFLKEIDALGLEVIVTELDARTDQLKVSNEERAKIAASYTKTYLDIVQAAVPLKTVLTWGLSSRHSWVMEQYKGAYAPLPLDDYLNRQPMWDVLNDWASS